ncbi:ABC transporter permease [Microbacterium aoyamense]|uniref:ABC transporter permease n=1 Tax=Microbacterium aoyamense TaxID=344166 RepID=A0ABN2PTI3_9MICO|nr:ABC transporter permease [Microbacterium aoyamense]
MTTTTETIAPPRRTVGARALDILGRYGVLIFLLLLIAVFSILLPGRFFTAANGVTILTGQAIPLILAIAVLFPLSAGEFDLSVAANLSFCGVWVAYSSSLGWPVVLVLVSALAIGAIIGAVNAFFIVKVGVNAFIATLAMGTILVGFNLLVTNGQLLFRGIPDELKKIGTTTFIGFPMTVWIAFALALVVWYILEFTPFGRYIRATGSGREAARLSGVRTGPSLAAVFIIAGTISGLAGFLNTAWIGSANPTSGPEFLLPAYAAAFLGATVIQPGLFNLWGTIIGALVLAVGISGLVIAGAPFWLPNVFNGVALLIAVSLSVLSARKRGDSTR